MAGIVWVLGAGFSRSLGGPLLGNLLSFHSLQTVRGIYAPSVPLGAEIMTALCLVYGHGTKYRFGRPRSLIALDEEGIPLWDNAEEFLEQADEAAVFGPNCASYERINETIRLARQTNFAFERLPPTEFAGAGRRLIAAECSAFLRKANIETERWSPYRRWVEQLLSPEDTIVTFNYDLVLERLNAKYDKFSIAPRGIGPTGKITVYKLHGSVNWRWTEERKEFQSADEDFWLKCPASEIGIAVPGPSKQIACRAIIEAWDNARFALTEADAVVFLGYRFPQTDSQGRDAIISSIRGNRREYISIHTVLGPNNLDADRVAGLVRYAALGSGKNKAIQSRREKPAPRGQYALLKQPMYVEDFLTIMSRGEIVEPNAEIIRSL